MAKLANIAKMSTATTGTGTITLLIAVTSFLTFAEAGVLDGDTISYAIEDGNEREVGRGVYSSSGTTLTRTVLASTNGGAAINLSGNAQVFVTALAEDIRPATQAQAEAGTNNEALMSPLRTAQAIAAQVPPDPFSALLLHVRDEKASGSHGGSSAATTWNIRTLNTVLTNEIIGASLSSNQITLPAGTYFIEAQAPVNSANGNQLRIRNVTDNSDILVGSTSVSFSTAAAPAIISGRFTLPAEKVIRLEHYTASASTHRGLGFAASTGVGEVYADCRIWKVV
jgi:hypothetical protein